MSELVNQRTAELLRAFIDKPKGSLIIEGAKASGKSHVITSIAKGILHDAYPSQFHEFAPEDGKAIGIDVARSIIALFSTKANAGTNMSRIAVIHDAELLTTEAQNALLKVIEEPSPRSMLIISVSDSAKLLSTIRSRCQQLPVLPMSRQQALNYAEKHGVDVSQAEKAFVASGGKNDLFLSFVNGESSSLNESKAFLQKSPFQRLQDAKSYDKRETLQGLLTDLTTIVEAAMRSSKNVSVERWQRIARELLQLQTLLERNVNNKLIYLRLSVMVY